MNEFLQQLAADPWGRLILQHLAAGGMRDCFLFLLVAARLVGVFVVAPIGTTSLIPLSVRWGIAVLLSLIVVPTLSFHQSGEKPVVHISHQESESDLFPESAIDFVSLIASEIGLGALLGVGVLAVLSGFKLGGEWLDRHSGLGLGSVMNPGWSAAESACSRLVPLVGIAVFLLLEPLGGHWLLVRLLAESFQAVPLGSGCGSFATFGLLNSLVQQSLLLGIRIAIPLVVTMLIVEFALAVAGRSAPVAVSSAAIVMKAGLGLFVIAMTLTRIPDVIVTTIISLFSSNSV